MTHNEPDTEGFGGFHDQNVRTQGGKRIGVLVSPDYWRWSVDPKPGLTTGTPETFVSAHVIVVKTAFSGDFTTKTCALRVVTFTGGCTHYSASAGFGVGIRTPRLGATRKSRN